VTACRPASSRRPSLDDDPRSPLALRASAPEFPWPDSDEILDDLITQLARIEAIAPRPDRP
jgi:hypothetical protein